jgi:NDP-sugar pyrophosphorylase family protein
MSTPNVVILAGGAGTRLAPLTDDRPAPLLPVVNRPIIEHLLEHLVRHHVTAATVCLHHRPYPLEAHLGDGTPWGIQLRYALERRPLGTGGAVRAVAGRASEPVLAVFATALTTADLEKMLALHQFREAALTLLVGSASEQGDVALDDEGGVVLDGGAGPLHPFAGVAVIDPRVLALVPAGTPADLLEDLVPRALAAGLGVQGVTAEPALVVRTAGDLVLANRRALVGDLPGLVLPGYETERGIRLSRGAVVHRSARLVPPVLIGANAVIGRGARVEATVIGDEVLVGPDSTIRSSVVCARTYVGRGLSLDGALVDRERIRREAAGTWTAVRDPRLFGDTRAPHRPRPGVAGRLLASALVVGAAPLWITVGALLALESRGRPTHSRRIRGARGHEVRLRKIAPRGPLGRFLVRLGIARAPQLVNVIRGDLHWAGTNPLMPAEWASLAAAGEKPPTSPGLVTLSDLAPGPLPRRDRLALDQLYAATRSRRGDVRLVAAALRHRLGRPRAA